MAGLAAGLVPVENDCDMRGSGLLLRKMMLCSYSEGLNFLI